MWVGLGWFWGLLYSRPPLIGFSEQGEELNTFLQNSEFHSSVRNDFHNTNHQSRSSKEEESKKIVKRISCPKIHCIAMVCCIRFHVL